MKPRRTQPRLSLAKAAVTIQSRSWLLPLLLFALTVGVFLPCLKDGFIIWDDTFYLTTNTHVKGGLTSAGFRWALTSLEQSNWHPLTWWSHMLDCSLYQFAPWGHHLTNVLLHGTVAALLFLVLRRMTGATWPSLLVAVLFGLHPLRVESVVAVNQRKEVLAGVFWMLTLWAYVRYARSPGPSRSSAARQNAGPRPLGPPPAASSRPWPWYGLALGFFALGLMSKTTVVTLPFVLLLLDFWPLDRWSLSKRRLVFEKVPFLGLTTIVSTLTYLAQKGAGRMDVLTDLTFWDRIGNGFVAYARYLGKLFWPTDLSAFYPHPGHWPAHALIPAMLLVLGVSAAVFFIRRRKPYLFVGWFWYLGVLVPMLGLVQVDAQSMADRYTYLPSVGFLLGLVWGLRDFARGVPWLGPVLASAGVSAAVACAAVTNHQFAYWKDSLTLFEHAAEIYEDSYVPHSCLGHVYLVTGRWEEARVQWEECVRLRPDAPTAHNQLGRALAELGRPHDAIVHFQKATELQPGFAEAEYNLGDTLFKGKRYEEAVRQFQKVIEVLGRDRNTNALYRSAQSELARTFMQTGKYQDALACLQSAVALMPADPDLRANLGMCQAALGRRAPAMANFREALKLGSDSVTLINNLAWLLATETDDTARNGAEAITLAQRACTLTQYRQPSLLDTLSAAYAQAGRFDDAVETAEKARALWSAAGDQSMAQADESLLKIYRDHKPCRFSSALAPNP